MSFIPAFYKVWLTISSLIVVWDTLYVLYRPSTMEGGQHFKYFFPYKTYITIDTLYGNLTDTFVVIQSKCNIVEIVLVGLSLLADLGRTTRAKAAAALLCLIASTFTFWKTIIYVMYGYPHLVFAAGKELLTFGVFILPTSFWLIFPLLGIFSIGDRLIRSLEATHKSE